MLEGGREAGTENIRKAEEHREREGGKLQKRRSRGRGLIGFEMFSSATISLGLLNLQTSE